MAITKIPAAGFTGNNFRNIIINGDMSIAQRGTSATGITSDSYNTVDRWKFGGVGTFTSTQSTDVPSGQGFSSSLKFDCTATGTPSAGDFFILRQRIEGQNLQYLKFGTSSAESLTCSFWVKTNKTGTYSYTLNGSDFGEYYTKSFTINSANTWEKKTITIPGNTANNFTNDNTNGMELFIWLSAGSNYTSGSIQNAWTSSSSATHYAPEQTVNIADSTSNEFYITGVQLEAGTTASDFEFLPYDVNEKRCLRYYWVHNYTNAFYAPLTSNDNYNVYWNAFPTPMRALPTLTETSGLGWTLTNRTRFQADLYRDPGGNYVPPDYTADAEL